MKHFISNFNIKDKRVLSAIKSKFPGGLDFCYTDPPWGTGNIKYWATMNKRMTGSEADILDQETMEDLVVNIICGNVKNYAFIVYGKKQVNSLVRKFKAHPNVKDVQVYSKKYKSGSRWLENMVVCVTLNDASVMDFSFLENANGLKGLKLVCEKFKGKYKTCLELFVGIGHYLKVLDRSGFVVCGNELNKSRLKKALAKV